MAGKRDVLRRNGKIRYLLASYKKIHKWCILKTLLKERKDIIIKVLFT